AGGQERESMSGWDSRQAVMAVANMVESLLRGSAADEPRFEDHLVAPVPAGDRVCAAVDGGASAREHRVDQPSVRTAPPAHSPAPGRVLPRARRGELIQPLPVGLVYTSAGKVVLDPDTGVQQAIRHLFATFTATGSAFATVKAFNIQGLRVQQTNCMDPER